MRRTVPFLIALLAGLGLLVLIGQVVLTRTTRAWFESDLALRSGLAVASAKQSLIENWSTNAGRLRGVLDDITRDAHLPVATVSGALAMLELKGMIRQVGGMQYVRI